MRELARHKDHKVFLRIDGVLAQERIDTYAACGGTTGRKDTVVAWLDQYREILRSIVDTNAFRGFLGTDRAKHKRRLCDRSCPHRKSTRLNSSHVSISCDVYC